MHISYILTGASIVCNHEGDQPCVVFVQETRAYTVQYEPQQDEVART